MKFKFNLKDVVIVILILLIGWFGFQYIKKGNIEAKYEAELKLNEALKDSVEHFQVQIDENEILYAAEKRTLQGSIDDLLDENTGLNTEQKNLLNRIDKLNKGWKKDKEVFAAAQIMFNTIIDSMNTVLGTASEIDTANNIVTFAQTDTAAHFIYDLDILGVRPYPELSHPEIQFNKVDFPNTQTITFNFDKNDRKDYPVSFTVLNTNPYFKVYDIQSYAIEGLTKDNINPTGWKRVWKWVKINGKYVLVGAAGFAVGAAVSGN